MPLPKPDIIAAVDTQPKNRVRKAVIAAAGFGTRFLPQTKAMPKEMLPVVDKPIIQYIVEELVAAGIEDIVIVTGYHKRSVEDHFDYISADLRVNLKRAGKLDLLEETKKISDLANFAYIRQKGPYGNATPLLNAEHLIGDEPFIYTWGDDFVLANPSRFAQIIETHNQTGGAVLTCIPAAQPEDYSRYAFVQGPEENGVVGIERIIEKPGSKEDSPSDIASVGGYLFTPQIFQYLKAARDKLPEGEEFIFQPSIQQMIHDGHKVYGRIVEGKFYDTGNKLEYLKTVVDFALMHDDLKDEFREYLKNLI
jgi:UTP--glucose-1-phosphate uridylyltransferase